MEVRERAMGIEENMSEAPVNVVQKKHNKALIAFSFPSVSIKDCGEMKTKKCMGNNYSTNGKTTNK